MAHYALINENNVVFNVITGRDGDEVVDGISDWEQYYGELHSCLCLRTSYNTQANTHLLGGTPFRGNYAGIGFMYLEDLDIFIPPKPYESWVIDETTALWVPPVAYPSDGGRYMWNEDTISWQIES